MRRAAKVDGNHGEILEAFRSLGCAVDDQSRLGNGRWDALIAVRGRRGFFVYAPVEIKDGKRSASRRRLTPAQRAFHAEWPDVIHIVTSVSEAEALVGRLRDL